MQHIITSLIGNLPVHYVTFCLMVSGFLGFAAYLAGSVMEKIAFYQQSQGQTVTWPYKPLSLSFHIAGIIDLVIVSVMLYFVGAYEPFFNLLRGL